VIRGDCPEEEQMSQVPPVQPMAQHVYAAFIHTCAAQTCWEALHHSTGHIAGSRYLLSQVEL
jgi:hypothetical protein